MPPVARTPRALRVVVAIPVLAAVVGGLAPAPVAATEPAPPPQGWVSGPGLTFLTAGQAEPDGLVVAPAGVLDTTPDGDVDVLSGAVDATTSGAALTPPANTDFVMDFDASVDAGTRRVIEAAAGIWSEVLEVRVPIVVDVSMQVMGPGILGGAKPVQANFGLPSFPRPDVLYPIALANQFAGRDLDASRADIEMVLSSTMDWDRSIDGSTSATSQPMLSVALHEMGHGLGHTSWVRQTSVGWAVNYVTNGTTVAFAYDRLVTTATGVALSSLPGSALPSAITTPLSWSGARGRAANGGAAPRLYSPSTFEAGSSVGHLDEATFTSEVMTPFLGRGELHTAVSPITEAMLADIGWTLSSTGAPSTTSTTSTTTAAPSPEPTPTATPTGPLTAAQRAAAFVTAVTTDFVGRPPTATELVRWRDQLLAGASRDVVTRSFAFSDEWIGVIVDGLYRSTLGRDADAAGRAHWVQVIRSGRTPAEVAAWFYASDEYFARAGGTATAWVTDLYGQIVGREPDARGLEFWASASSRLPREAIAHDFYQSVESRGDRVARLFETLLGRSPDTGGASYWTGVLANGRDVDLAVFLAASDEYAARAARRFA